MKKNSSGASSETRNSTIRVPSPKAGRRRAGGSSWTACRPFRVNTPGRRFSLRQRHRCLAFFDEVRVCDGHGDNGARLRHADLGEAFPAPRSSESRWLVEHPITRRCAPAIRPGPAVDHEHGQPLRINLHFDRMPFKNDLDCSMVRTSPEGGSGPQFSAGAAGNIHAHKRMVP